RRARLPKNLPSRAFSKTFSPDPLLRFAIRVSIPQPINNRSKIATGLQIRHRGFDSHRRLLLFAGLLPCRFGNEGKIDKNHCPLARSARDDRGGAHQSRALADTLNAVSLLLGDCGIEPASPVSDDKPYPATMLPQLDASLLRAAVLANVCQRRLRHAEK